MVDAFYTFWFSFKSWREFPHPDEEDIEQVGGADSAWPASNPRFWAARCARCAPPPPRSSGAAGTPLPLWCCTWTL